MKTFKCVLTVIAVSILVFSCASTGGSDGGAEVMTFSWVFEDPDEGTAGWVVAEGEFWDYRGTAVLSRDDTTFERGMLRFDVDFTANSSSEWSEPKIKYEFDEPLEMRGITRFTFDIFYNPSLSSGGSFNSKIILLSGRRTIVESVGSLIGGNEDAGNGFLKATVTLPIRRNSATIDNIVFSIAGYLTNYRGPVFFENLRLE